MLRASAVFAAIATANTRTPTLIRLLYEQRIAVGRETVVLSLHGSRHGFIFVRRLVQADQCVFEQILPLARGETLDAFADADPYLQNLAQHYSNIRHTMNNA
jgi:hypothetical protein